MPLTALFADLADPGAELVALREHLERETGLLVFSCRNAAGQHTASAFFPLNKDEATRLMATIGQTGAGGHRLVLEPRHRQAGSLQPSCGQ